MALPAHLRKRAKPKGIYDGAVLGVYRGPARVAEPPKLTPYRLTLLRAIEAKEVKAGQQQYTGAWRWHHDHQGVTVTRYINEFLRCGWAKVVGAHVELDDAGRSALDGVQWPPLPNQEKKP